MNNEISTDHIPSWAFWGVVLAFGLICLSFQPFIADDSYIVGRYALNAASGIGLVYNEGEYVSALTSPLHALFETLIASLGLPPVETYRILAPFILLASVLGAGRLARLTSQERLIFVAIALTSPFVGLWSVGGLETAILTSTLVLFVAILIGASRSGGLGRQSFLGLGVLAGLSFLTRYDSLLILLPPMLAVAWIHRTNIWLWVSGLVAAILAGIWLLFAYLYFGDVFPTSAHIKLGLGPGTLGKGILYIVNFALVTGFALLLLLRLSNRGQDSNVAGLLRVAFWASALIFLAYAAVVSTKHMAFGYRTFVPIIPLLGLFVAIGGAKFRQTLLLILVFNGFTVALMHLVGMNVTPLRNIPGQEPIFYEYAEMTPRAYGVFIQSTRTDAGKLRAHWTETGRPEKPSIFLITGGTGYFLMDFYVLESLVSFRKNCEVTFFGAMGSTHYVQDFNGEPQRVRVASALRARQDFDELTPVVVSPFSQGGDIVYWYGPKPIDIPYSARVHDPC